MQRLMVASLMCFAFSTFECLSVAQGHQYTSRKYRFSLEVPMGWRYGRSASEGLPLIINFQWSQLQPQLDLPKGGAIIHMISEEGLPEPNGSYTLEEWAEFDERAGVSETVSSRALSLPKETGISRAIMASFDEKTYSPSEQRQHQTAVYWDFRGRRFAAYLNFIVGDPKAKEYRDTLLEIMRSFRPE